MTVHDPNAPHQHAIKCTTTIQHTQYNKQQMQAVVFSIRTHAELELHMGSVERVLEYSTVAQEAAAVVPAHRPPDG